MNSDKNYDEHYTVNNAIENNAIENNTIENNTIENNVSQEIEVCNLSGLNGISITLKPVEQDSVQEEIDETTYIMENDESNSVQEEIDETAYVMENDESDSVQEEIDETAYVMENDESDSVREEIDETAYVMENDESESVQEEIDETAYVMENDESDFVQEEIDETTYVMENDESDSVKEDKTQLLAQKFQRWLETHTELSSGIEQNDFEEEDYEEDSEDDDENSISSSFYQIFEVLTSQRQEFKNLTKSCRRLMEETSANTASLVTRFDDWNQFQTTALADARHESDKSFESILDLDEAILRLYKVGESVIEGFLQRGQLISDGTGNPVEIGSISCDANEFKTKDVLWNREMEKELREIIQKENALQEEEDDPGLEIPSNMPTSEVINTFLQKRDKGAESFRLDFPKPTFWQRLWCGSFIKKAFEDAQKQIEQKFSLLNEERHRDFTSLLNEMIRTLENTPVSDYGVQPSVEQNTYLMALYKQKMNIMEQKIKLLDRKIELLDCKYRYYCLYGSQTGMDKKGNSQYLQFLENQKLQMIKARESDENALSSFFDGLKILKNRLDKILEKHEITRIDQINVPFEIMSMTVMELGKDTNIPSDYVLSVLRPGYRMGDRVLRFAEVCVNKITD